MITHRGHVGDVKSAAVGGTISTHQTRTIHGEPHCNAQTTNITIPITNSYIVCYTYRYTARPFAQQNLCV